MVEGLAGDAAAYKSLLSRLSGSLRAYFRGRLARMGRGAVEAEDLVQEALIAVHTRRDTYDPSQPFTPWVYAIARYKLVDHLRRTKTTIKDVPIEEAEDVLADSDSTATESAIDLDGLLSQLSPKARQAIQYVKLEGLSVSEAAARTGMSQSADKVSIHRGLKALALLIRRSGRS